MKFYLREKKSCYKHLRDTNFLTESCICLRWGSHVKHKTHSSCNRFPSLFRNSSKFKCTLILRFLSFSASFKVPWPIMSVPLSANKNQLTSSLCYFSHASRSYKLLYVSALKFNLMNLKRPLLIALHCFASSDKKVGSTDRGGSRIFLRRGCASKEWRHWPVR